jgi:hypothetical protein
MAKSNESLSLNETVKMYGVEIKKMPCGKYFEALQTLKNLPEDFIKELSDNKQDFRLSEMLSLDNLINLITKLLMVAPKFLFSFLSKLLDVDEEYIENKLSLTELTEICIKFWEINKLENFFVLMKPAIRNIMILTGFKK